MPKRNSEKKEKYTRSDLDKAKQKEILARRELAKKSKLPKGIFENTGGDDRLKSSKQMISDLKRRLDMYEDKKSSKRKM
jgi:hypothetical protein